MSFADLGLCDSLLEAVAKSGYDTPSPIQAKAIPAILEGKDVMAAAQTGTGKTAGFTLPILENLLRGNGAKANQARALVLTPTRELAAQVGESVQAYGQNLSLRSTVVFGGVKINPQMQKLRRGVDVLVATPGRLLDLYNQNAVKFDHLEVLVLDEADRMLDMGFIHDIRKVIKLLPRDRQNLMFSATFSADIRQLAKTIVHQPVEISVTPENAAAPTVKQWMVPVDKRRKSELLTRLILDNAWGQVLVFSRTKHGANKLTKKLEAAGIRAAAIHGNKSQGARTRALAEFKANKVQVLVATDIAARGLDIDQLPQVVNFDLPNVPEDYVHRIGRTGRAGAVGQAVSLVSADELQQLKDIERLTKKLLEREYVEGFDPEHDVPETQLNTKAFKAKKPKKPKQGQQQGAGNNSNPNSRSRNRRNTNQGNSSQAKSNQETSDRGPKRNPNQKQNGQQNQSGNPNQNQQSKRRRPKNKPSSQNSGNSRNSTSAQGNSQPAPRADVDGNTRAASPQKKDPWKKTQRPKNDPRGPRG